MLKRLQCYNNRTDSSFWLFWCFWSKSWSSPNNWLLKYCFHENKAFLRSTTKNTARKLYQLSSLNNYHLKFTQNSSFTTVIVSLFLIKWIMELNLDWNSMHCVLFSYNKFCVVFRNLHFSHFTHIPHLWFLLRD